MVKVVVVDDYKETAEALSMIYSLNNDVEIIGLAYNSKQLWDIVSEKKVDIVSLDIQLGRENGLEVCKLLHEKRPDVFIVMCSVEATEENKKLAKEYGASHFLAKPLSLKDVSETIQMFSDRKRTVDTDLTPLTDEMVDGLLGTLS